MPSTFTESVVEDATPAWLGALDYTVLHGPEIALAPGIPAGAAFACNMSGGRRSTGEEPE